MADKEKMQNDRVTRHGVRVSCCGRKKNWFEERNMSAAQTIGLSGRFSGKHTNRFASRASTCFSICWIDIHWILDGNERIKTASQIRKKSKKEKSEEEKNLHKSEDEKEKPSDKMKSNDNLKRWRGRMTENEEVERMIEIDKEERTT